MALPLIDSLPVGQHPLVSRLMKGIYNQCPPSWDVGAIIQIFCDWPSPHYLHDQIRKTAFLLAMASTQRLSELASLRVSDNLSIFILVPDLFRLG